MGGFPSGFFYVLIPNPQFLKFTEKIFFLQVIGQSSGSENAGTGLSVEQKKRVTIGVEMVSNPSVIFLDEPTSGLDSRSARVIMRAIRRIAQSGRTVVCTIHQPSFEIFSMFDRLLLSFVAA